MRIIRLFLITALIFTAAACTTPYQPEGYGGGYSDMPLGGSKFRVDARGNGETPLGRVQDIALVRAAELALQHGYSHFIILDSGQDTKTKMMVVNSTLSSYDNHYTSLVFKGVRSSSGALSAKKILAEVGPRVGYEKVAP